MASPDVKKEYVEKFYFKKVGKWIPLCCTLDAIWIIIIL